MPEEPLAPSKIRDRRILLGAAGGVALVLTAVGIRASLGGSPAPPSPVAEPSTESTTARSRAADAAPTTEAVREARAPVAEPATVASVPDRDPCDSGTICGVVLAPWGRPQPGATCSLYPGRPPTGIRFLGGLAAEPGSPVASAVASVRSDAAGVFRLSAPPGYWTLRVEHEGFRPWSDESLRAGSHRRVRLEVEHGAGVLALLVESEEGVPIGDAQALLLENAYSDRATARSRTRSDAAGWAEMELEPHGSWYVEVSHPSYRSRVFRAPDASGALRMERSVTLSEGIRIHGVVSLAAGPGSGREWPEAEVIVDSWSPDPTRTVACSREGLFDTGPVFAPDDELELTARAPGYAEKRLVLRLEAEQIVDGALDVNVRLDAEEVRVRGRVQAVQGMAPGRTEVLVKPIEEGDARQAASHAVAWRAMATTDASGAFEIEGLMAHHPYQLLVMPRERYGNALVRVPALAPGTLHDLGEVTVAEGATIFGFARRADGTPVPRLPVVTISIVDGTPGGDLGAEGLPEYLTGRRTAYTNQEGRFEISLVPAGATCELYRGERIRQDELVDRFRFSAGEVVGPIEIVVPYEDDEVFLRGTVSDPSGAPVASVLVQVWNGPEGATGEGVLLSPVSGKLTGESGAFRLGRMSPDREYRVTATDLRGRFAKETVYVTPSSRGEGLSLALTRNPVEAQNLWGVVVDENGSPLAGIDVTLHVTPLIVRCDCLSWNQRTDEFGRFSFGPVLDGEHQVAAMDPSGRYAAARVTALPGPPVPITVLERARQER